MRGQTTSARICKIILGIGLALSGIAVWSMGIASSAGHVEGSSLGVIFGGALAVMGMALGFIALAPRRDYPM